MPAAQESDQVQESDEAQETDDDARPGALLLAAIEEAANLRSDLPDDIEIRAVECLSACDNGCSVALSFPGKWSYVYGHMTTDNAADILDGAVAYSASTDGLVRWRERPQVFRKQCLGRVPPQSPGRNTRENTGENTNAPPPDTSPNTSRDTSQET